MGSLERQFEANILTTNLDALVKRSISYREDTVAIISIAQQARPNVIGNNADFRDQFTNASRLVVRIFASNCLSREPINDSVKGEA